MSNDHDTQKVSFGFEDIDLSEKTGRVRGLFSSVADKYDLMNDVLSAGLHRLWKEQFVSLLNPSPHKTYLDMAGGTGDIALKIAQKRGSGKGIFIGDLTYNMLAKGMERKDPYNDEIPRICINAQKLPFKACEFDGYTISYGIRNVTEIELALCEAYRVLKAGGKFMCLEFSLPENPDFKKIYDFYSFKLLPQLGKFFASDADSYRYLAESIRRFPSVKKFSKMLQDAGFQNISHHSLAGGITTIYTGYKITL